KNGYKNNSQPEHEFRLQAVTEDDTIFLDCRYHLRYLCKAVPVGAGAVLFWYKTFFLLIYTVHRRKFHGNNSFFNNNSSFNSSDINKTWFIRLCCMGGGKPFQTTI
ncbi:hypothetical protein, partial [Bacteroides acidifaciens]|uniref:hypothetical protein n=1 Tax=Bacteroides acidifaciens TaxID=85831 RepID=UPI0030155A49